MTSSIKLFGTTNSKSTRRIGVFFVGLWFASAAFGERLSDITIGERALLPPFCEETMGFKHGADVSTFGPNSAYWIGLMGKSFRTMHHYCFGLVRERRAFAPGKKSVDRSYAIASAIDEFNYVINNSEPGFIMLPEIFVKKADLQVMLAQYAEAIDSFRSAVAAKPDFWRAYSRWAAALDQMKSRKAALAILEDGMRAAPSEPRLRAQYKQLGGDPDKFPLAPAVGANVAGQQAAPAASSLDLAASAAKP